MRSQGAAELASAMTFSKTLVKLDLGWNGFGDLRPVDALGDYLKKASCTLTHLDLSHNR